MKTYYLEEQYGEAFKITVDDDVQVNVNSYDHNHEGALIKFTTQGPNYSDNVIAAFGRISRVYLEGTQIEKREYQYPVVDEVAKAEPTAPTWTMI